MGAVHDSEGRSSPWSITLKVNGLPITFKIDTGADVSVIPESTFRALGLPLRPTTRFCMVQVRVLLMYKGVSALILFMVKSTPGKNCS